MRWPALAALALIGAGVAGCGLQVQSADLFALTRVGLGRPLSIVVNDSGTIRCNGGSARSLPGPLLLQARDLATSLDNDAKAGLHIPRSRDTIATYTVKLQDGTITFPDTAGAKHSELAQAQQFALQAASGPCGLSR